MRFIGSVLLLIVFASGIGAQGDGIQGGAVGFRARISPETVYVGQQATYELIVTIPPEIRQRLRRNPQFVAPETRAMLAYDLPVPRRDPTREGPEIHSFKRALFPVTAGRHPIPSARLSYMLPQNQSFFSQEEERSHRTEPLMLVAVDPPLAGRPANWGGAVGEWRASVRVDASNARVGDPFVLTLRIDGTGNAALLPRPELAIPWANVVAEDERLVLDSTPTLLAGYKEFSWLVTPRESGLQTVPALEYHFLSPAARRYLTARTQPVRVSVSPGTLVSIPESVREQLREGPLSIRAQPAGGYPIALPVPYLWIALAALAPFPWLIIGWRRRKPKARREPTTIELLRDGEVSSVSDVRRLFDAGLRERTGILMEGVTSAEALSHALRREGVTLETARDAEVMRDSLETIAFSRSSTVALPLESLRTKVLDILKRIDVEARKVKHAVFVVLAAALLGGCFDYGTTEEATLHSFSEGSTAYMGHDYIRARDAFLKSANSSPRDPNAWSNLGTAAWAAGDTATAVLGWQRALRLNPMNDELRTRLQKVRAPQGRGIAKVWQLPTLQLSVAALALWLFGWTWAAVRRRRRKHSALALVVLIPAVGLSLLALAGEIQSRSDSLVVIAGNTPLRSLPALGSEPRSVPLVGEIAKIEERRGVWYRLSLDAGRDGWYPAERTYPLARR